MPSQSLDLTAVLAGLDRLSSAIDEGISSGCDAYAVVLEATDKATTAYVGMSGATRESTVAFAIGNGKDGSTAIGESYAAAVQALTGFTGHQGQPAQISVPALGQDEQAVILSNSTNYAALLETQNAGEKAHLGESLLSTLAEGTRLIAAHSKARLV
jgi:hypothetical protein